MTIDAALILGLSIGVPVALLALAIVLRTRADVRQANADVKAAKAQQTQAEGQVGALLGELQSAVQEMREQLSTQRESLSALMSEGARAEVEQAETREDDINSIASRIAAAELIPAVASSNGDIPIATNGNESEVSLELAEPVALQSEPAARAEVPPLTPAPPSPSTEPKDTRTTVLEMLGDGLTDRQVARRLRIGVEEVRLIAGLPTKTTRKRAS